MEDILYGEDGFPLECCLNCHNIYTIKSEGKFKCAIPEDLECPYKVEADKDMTVS